MNPKTLRKWRRLTEERCSEPVSGLTKGEVVSVVAFVALAATRTDEEPAELMRQACAAAATWGREQVLSGVDPAFDEDRPAPSPAPGLDGFPEIVRRGWRQ